MRKLFFESAKRKNKKTILKLYPWISIIVPVCYGYLLFESVEDYKTWKGQK